MILLNILQKNISNKMAMIKDNSLKARSARGAITLTVGTVIERGMRLVRNMILARLLAPDDFGLMAIVLAVLVCMESLTDVGVQQSIIHNKEGSSPAYLNVSWWLQAIRGAGLFAIAFLAAPLVCEFYDKPDLLNLLRVSFASILLGGLASPRMVVLEKEFRFLKAVLLIQGCALFGALLAIGFAIYMQNVWVLVIGRIGESCLRFVLSFIFCPFLPRFSIDRNSLKELLRFSRGMLGLSFLTIIALQVDVFVLAKLVSTERLGMYALALALAQQPAGLFFQIIGRVLLPAFAEKQDNKAALCRAVLRITKITTLFAVPLATLAVIYGGNILSLVYGERYSAVGVPFGLLCVSALLLTEGMVFGNVLLGIGEPAKHRVYVGLRTLILVVLIYPAIKLFGLTGAASAVLLANLIALCLQVVVIHKTIGLDILNYVTSWLSGVLLGLFLFFIEILRHFYITF